MRSSTSSSEPPARPESALVDFGVRLLWLVPGCLVLLIALNAAAIRFDLAATPQLANIHLQIARLERAERVDTLLLGDSSLGRLFDPATWDALAGERSLGLPLTGAEGYAGDLGLLQRLLAAHRPRRVVLMHTADMPTRQIAWQGHLIARPPHAPPVPMPLHERLGEWRKLLVNGELLRATLRGLAYRATGRPWPFLGARFVELPARLRRPIFDPASAPVFSAGDLRPEKRLFLDRLAALCAAERLDCRYAIGPLWDAVCASSTTYLEASRAFIESSGLPVIEGTPFCVPASDLDDTLDHVRAERMAGYTARLLDLLGPLPAGDPAAR
jgi:hypothetical protein